MADQIRSVTRADLPRLAELLKICGFPPRSVAGLDWVLFGNPAQGDAPPGWVYERDGRVSGFSGSFGTELACAGGRFRAAMGHTLVTDVDGRNMRAGIRLVRHSMAQPGLDACFTLNNNTLSARILPRTGLKPWLGETGRGWAEWITNPVRYAAYAGFAQVKRRALPGLAWPGRERLETGPAGALSLDAGWPDAAVPLDDVPVAAQQAFFARLTEGETPVRAVTPQDIAWRRADPDRTGGSVWRAWFRDGEMRGLIGALVVKAAPGAAEALEVVEFLTVPGSDGVQAGRDLLAGLLEAARRDRLARVRLRFAALRDPAVLEGLPRPMQRRQGHDSCHLMLPNPDPRLRNWRPAPGDADFFFSLRTPPALMTV